MREINQALPKVSRARDAFAWLQAELEKIRAGTVEEAPRAFPRFRDFAGVVFERKKNLGKIRSPAGRAKWESILYQDLARAAGVHDAVTRAISGHATPAMQMRYSTARSGEVRTALAKVAGIATGRDVIDLAAERRWREARSSEL